MAKDDDERLSERTTLGVLGWLTVGVVGVVYLVNPGAGLLELIPDNLPMVGNLDEATATVLVLSAFKYLTGIDLTGRGRRLLGRKRES